MMSFLYIEGAEDGAAEGVVLHPLLHGEKIGGGVGKLCVDLVAERRGVESGYFAFAFPVCSRATFACNRGAV